MSEEAHCRKFKNEKLKSCLIFKYEIFWTQIWQIGWNGLINLSFWKWNFTVSTDFLNAAN